jgi:ABC-type amino acid transport substrate-binding protein
MSPGALFIPGYEGLSEIGRGGFATVYRARQVAFAREVAVKVIDRPNPDEATLDQFRRECQAVGSLSWHPHVVSVYDAGTTEDGRPYLTMELLPGGSLGDALDRGPMPVDQVISFGHQIADAVASAHEVGVLHRDLKPANILVDRRGGARLADFGIARIAGGGATTTAGAVTGTIAYMAPELLRGERATAASDIYGIGMTIAALLLGRSPLSTGSEETPWAMLQRVAEERVPDLRAAGAPAPLADLVAACTAKDPAARPTTATEVQTALGTMLAASGVDVTVDARTRPHPVDQTVFTGPPPPLTGSGPERRRSGLAVAALIATAAVVLIAVVATVAAVWLGRDNDDGRTASTTTQPASGPDATGTLSAAGVDLVTPGTLTMCTDLPFEPFAFRGDGPGEITGFDVDLVRAVAGAADLELEVIDVGRGGIFDGPAEGDCDVGGLAITILPERAEDADFTEPYFDADQSLLVATAPGHTNLADLLASFDDPRLGVVGGTTGDAYAAGSIEGAEILEYPTVEAVLAALDNGEVDGVVQDLPINAYRAEQDRKVEVIETFATGEQYGYIVEKGDTELLELLNAGLDQVRDDGTYDELYVDYFGAEPGN